MPPRVVACYTIAPGVAWRRLGDDAAVYVAASFETHLLDWSGCGVLEALQSAMSPCTPGQLHAALLQAEPDDGGDVATPGDEPPLSALLSHLVRLGVLSEQAC